MGNEICPRLKFREGNVHAGIKIIYAAPEYWNTIFKIREVKEDKFKLQITVKVTGFDRRPLLTK